MNCLNCQREIPALSRFCNFCGAEQVLDEVTLEKLKPYQPQFDSKDGFTGLAREAALESSLDYEAQRQFESATGAAFSCLGYIGIVLVGLMVLIPGVPLLAIIGVPLGLVLGVLTYFNAWHLQSGWLRVPVVRILPGLKSSRGTQATMVTVYLVAVSLVCLWLMIATQRTGSVPPPPPQHTW